MLSKIVVIASRPQWDALGKQLEPVLPKYPRFQLEFREYGPRDDRDALYISATEVSEALVTDIKNILCTHGHKVR